MLPDHGIAALADHLASRRDQILAEWQVAMESDRTLTTGATLPRAQRIDHIPALLKGFESQLRDPETGASHVGNAAAHGMQRWQQGFGLAEVSRELGHLNECMVSELEACSRMRAVPAEPEALSTARQMWAGIFRVAVGASTSQYFKLQQRESASHANELEAALISLRNLERQRAALWQQAAHDLRGNLGVVANVAAGLGYPNLDGPQREHFMRLLDRNMQALHKLLDDITWLARLQGGQETRRLEAVNVAALLTEIGENLQPLAAARGLTLEWMGEAGFMVQSDAVKLHRIVQNLVLNAIRYTVSGGVKVSWGGAGPNDPGKWVLQVQDTGPGLAPGSVSDVLEGPDTATRNARELARSARFGEVPGDAEYGGLSRPDVHVGHGNGTQAIQGEGIGLSIVKRLCDLLNATVHVDSGQGGTCFRIWFPVRYAFDPLDAAASGELTPDPLDAPAPRA